MKAILMSIKPKYVSMILNKVKTIEVRKRFPSNYVGWVYIYCTKTKPRAILTDKGVIVANTLTVGGNSQYKSGYSLSGKVVARFWCDKVEEITTRQDRFKEFMFYETSLDMEDLLEQGCLDYNELDNYLYGKNGYAIHITKLEIFDKPKEINEFHKVGFDVKEYNQAVFCLKNNVHYTFEPDEYLEKYQLTRAPQSWCYIEL